MAIRKVLLPLTGTAAGEAALATSLMIARAWNAHVAGAARPGGQPRRGAAGRRRPVRRDDRGNDVGDREGKQRPRPRGSRHVRPLRHPARRDDRRRPPWRRPRHRQLRRGHRPGGRPGGAAGPARRPDRGAAPRRRRGRVILRRAARRTVRFRPAGADLAASATHHDRHPRLPGLERHGGIGGLGPGSDALDAAGGGSAHPVGGRLPAARTGGAGTGGLPGAARHPRRTSRCSTRSATRWAPDCWRRRRRFGCDLLSMGAYSHSRLRQLILGGVTRHVLENSNLPVMMTR